jgi:hypothetical protein
MSDRTDKNRDVIQRVHSADVCRHPRLTPEQARIAYAQARSSEHGVRELYFLELAVQAPDEDSANALEIYAYEAYKDALAITKEHELDD